MSLGDSLCPPRYADSHCGGEGGEGLGWVGPRSICGLPLSHGGVKRYLLCVTDHHQGPALYDQDHETIGDRVRRKAVCEHQQNQGPFG